MDTFKKCLGCGTELLSIGNDRCFTCYMEKKQDDHNYHGIG